MCSDVQDNSMSDNLRTEPGGKSSCQIKLPSKICMPQPGPKAAVHVGKSYHSLSHPSTKHAIRQTISLQSATRFILGGMLDH